MNRLTELLELAIENGIEMEPDYWGQGGPNGSGADFVKQTAEGMLRAHQDIVDDLEIGTALNRLAQVEWPLWVTVRILNGQYEVLVQGATGALLGFSGQHEGESFPTLVNRALQMVPNASLNFAASTNQPWPSPPTKEEP